MITTDRTCLCIVYFIIFGHFSATHFINLNMPRAKDRTTLALPFGGIETAGVAEGVLEGLSDLDWRPDSGNELPGVGGDGCRDLGWVQLGRN